MQKWEPTGQVSHLTLPDACSNLDVVVAWMPVGNVSVDASPPDLTGIPLVDPSEASTFVTQKRAVEHAAGRYTLATLLRDIGFNPLELRIIRDEYRKPNLIWREAEDRTKADGKFSSKLPEISLSHSNGVAIAAVSMDGSLIGIDAEPSDAPRPRNLLTMMASGEELEYLENHWSTDERVGMQESTQTWVVKEAVQKASGLGMHVSPQSFSVLNTDQVIVTHENTEYKLDVVHWRQMLAGRSFVVGFSRLIEVINLNSNR